MKKLTFLMTLILFVGCTPIVYTPVPTDEVNIQGTKNELYVKANLWMVDQFSNAKSVIQFSDKEAGVIKGRYLLYYKPSGQYVGEISYYAIITITASDNILKMEIKPDDSPNALFYNGDRMTADISNLHRKFREAFQK